MYIYQVNILLSMPKMFEDNHQMNNQVKQNLEHLEC